MFLFLNLFYHVFLLTTTNCQPLCASMEWLQHIYPIVWKRRRVYFPCLCKCHGTELWLWTKINLFCVFLLSFRTFTPLTSRSAGQCQIMLTVYNTYTVFSYTKKLACNVMTMRKINVTWRYRKLLTSWRVSDFWRCFTKLGNRHCQATHSGSKDGGTCTEFSRRGDSEESDQCGERRAIDVSRWNQGKSFSRATKAEFDS